MAELLSITHTAEGIRFEARVEDAIQVAPATRWDPAEFGSGVCEYVFDLDCAADYLGHAPGSAADLMELFEAIDEDDWTLIEL
jgi:hypothetical protein